jgi:hypothetical protein
VIQVDTTALMDALRALDQSIIGVAKIRANAPVSGQPDRMVVSTARLIELPPLPSLERFSATLNRVNEIGDTLEQSFGDFGRAASQIDDAIHRSLNLVDNFGDLADDHNASSSELIQRAMSISDKITTGFPEEL